MRTYPSGEYDEKELARLDAPQWMVELLKLNPSYPHWGPHEDYMWKEGQGWDSAVVRESWKEFDFGLDECNEVVNFYFEIDKPSKDCPTCGGNGYNPDAQWISESWYSHCSPFNKQTSQERELNAALKARFGMGDHKMILPRGAYPPDALLEKYGKPFFEHCVTTMENGGHWDDNITQDEADALWKAGRLKFEFKKKPTAKQVNEWQRGSRKPGHGFGHDSINSHICIEQRCKRLGIRATCPECDGHGSVFTGPAFLTLVLWVLHPRKGASRGVEVKHIEQSDLPQVFGYLREAAERNAERFSRIPQGEPWHKQEEAAAV